MPEPREDNTGTAIVVGVVCFITLSAALAYGATTEHRPLLFIIFDAGVIGALSVGLALVVRRAP